jgi:glycosyltransferase 2 family protein
VIPFATAISIMGIRELWLNIVKPWQERRRLQAAYDDQDTAERAAPAAVPQRIKRHSQR